jgi:hypothetical protein
MRTLLPFGLATIESICAEDGRCVIVYDATLTSGFGAELTAVVQEFAQFSERGPVTDLGSVLPRHLDTYHCLTLWTTHCRHPCLAMCILLGLLYLSVQIPSQDSRRTTITF